MGLYYLSNWKDKKIVLNLETIWSWWCFGHRTLGCLDVNREFMSDKAHSEEGTNWM